MSPTICFEKIHHPPCSLESSNQRNRDICGFPVWMAHLSSSLLPLKKENMGVLSDVLCVLLAVSGVYFLNIYVLFLHMWHAQFTVLFIYSGSAVRHLANREKTTFWIINAVINTCGVAESLQKQEGSSYCQPLKSSMTTRANSFTNSSCQHKQCNDSSKITGFRNHMILVAISFDNSEKSYLSDTELDSKKQFSCTHLTNTQIPQFILCIQCQMTTIAIWQQLNDTFQFNQMTSIKYILW